MTALVINGATRLIPIVGDPIAQVKSPAGVTLALQQRALNAACVPVHVAADDVEAFIDVAERVQVGDPFPIVAKLASPTFIADVITAPATTPLIVAARAAGCGVQVGAAMFEGVNERMVRFLLQTDDGGGETRSGGGEPRNGRISG